MTRGQDDPWDDGLWAPRQGSGDAADPRQGSFRSGGRLSRGIRLARVSWQVVAEQPETLGLIAVGLLAYFGIAAGLFVAVFQRWPNATDLRFPHYLVVFPILWVGSLAANYYNFAVTAIADRRLRGEQMTVSEAVEVANTRIGRLVCWTVVSGVVGLILQVIADRVKLAGPIAKAVIGLSWGLAVTFVVPILVLDDLSVTEAVRKSAGMFKARWGETVAADGGVALPILLAMVPLAIIAAILGTAVAPAAGIAFGASAFIVAVVVIGTLGAVVKVALFNYASTGLIPAPFSEQDLDSYYRQRRNGWT